MSIPEDIHSYLSHIEFYTTMRTFFRMSWYYRVRQMTIKAADLRNLAKHRKCVIQKFPDVVKTIVQGLDPYQFGCELHHHCATHCKLFTKCPLIQNFNIFSGQHPAGGANIYVMEEG